MRNQRVEKKASLVELTSLEDLEGVSGGYYGRSWRNPSCGDMRAMSSSRYQQVHASLRAMGVSAAAERHVGWKNLACRYGL